MEREIVMILVYIFEMIISFCFFTRIYEKKQKSNATVILIGLGLFIPSSIIFNVIDNIIVNLIVFFVINFAFAILCFDIPKKNAAIQSIILDALMYSAEILTIFVLSMVIGIAADSYRNDVYALLIIVIISKLVYFVLSQLLAAIVIKMGHKKNSATQFMPLFMFPILTMISCTLFLYTASTTKVTTMYKVTSAVVCVLFIVSSVFIFVYYQSLANKESKINELEMESRLYNLNTTYMNVLEHQNSELQMLFHDTKNHFLTIGSFEKIEDVRKYIGEIYPYFENKNKLRISSNKMLDLILNKYIVVCQQKNIKFTYEAKTANLSYIDDSELSVILNNILDNAVEAAERSTEKRVELSLRNVNGMDILSVENSSDKSPNHLDDTLFTTKSDAGNHGFGTKIIKRHAEQNHGSVRWSYDSQRRTFRVTILFQKPTENKEIIKSEVQ